MSEFIAIIEEFQEELVAYKKRGFPKDPTEFMSKYVKFFEAAKSALLSIENGSSLLAKFPSPDEILNVYPFPIKVTTSRVVTNIFGYVLLILLAVGVVALNIFSTSWVNTSNPKLAMLMQLVIIGLGLLMIYLCWKWVRKNVLYTRDLEFEDFVNRLIQTDLPVLYALSVSTTPNSG